MSPTTWLQNDLQIDYNISAHIADMVSETEQPCVSVIVPTHSLGQDRQGDRMELQQAISAAKQLIAPEKTSFLMSIDDLVQQIDFRSNKEGVGIFVSPHIQKLVRFPFPVTKKIVVNRFFHLHDLLYIENYKTAYYVLDISKKAVHLFRGLMDDLEQIGDENFPKEIVEEYEYNKPGPSAAGRGYARVKDVEKDKSILTKARVRKIYQDADKALSKYVVNKNIPLVLCGPAEDISMYRAVTDHSENIVVSISDNYKGASIHDLGLLAWLQVRSFLDRKKLSLVKEFNEKIGNGLGLCGVQEVWSAANEGRGLVLLVEKNFEQAGFVGSDDNLYLQQSRDDAPRYPDLVNEITTTVLRKKGKVVIVEKDILKDFKRIALILRY
ncbi:MAG TPA: hypothetical protein VFP87_14685 [Chitinophagaceae bacterium]|nr:hypothetical protein [Chitinophagaceae bacterium]